MQTAEKLAHNVYTVVIAIISAFLVDFGVRFMFITGLQYVHSSYDDIIIGVMGFAFLVAGVHVRLRLQNSLGAGLSWGLSFGLFMAGITLCKSSLWWESNISPWLVMIGVACFALIAAMYLYRRWQK